MLGEIPVHVNSLFEIHAVGDLFMGCQTGIVAPGPFDHLGECQVVRLRLE